MAKSLPLWAIAIACFCTDWLFYMLLTSMPTFMSSVLHFDLSEVSAALRLVSAAAMGLGCSLAGNAQFPQGYFFPRTCGSGTSSAAASKPLAVSFCSLLCRTGSSPPCPTLGTGWGTSWRGCWPISSWPGGCSEQQLSGSSSQHWVGTGFHLLCSLPNVPMWHIIKHVPFSAGMLLPSIFLVAVPYIGCSSTAAVVLLTLALTIISMTGAGININHIDIAPR